MSRFTVAVLLAALATGAFIARHSLRSEEGPPPAPAKVYGEWLIRVRPDRGAEYGRLIREQGLPLFRAAGGRMVGWWTTLVGDLYEHVTIWEYDGLAGFEKAVAFLGKDERFKKFVELRDPLLAGEESRFLRLAPGGEAPALDEKANVVVHEVHRVPPGRWRDYWERAPRLVDLYRKKGFRVAGPFQPIAGRESEVTYLWLHDSLAEREAKLGPFGRHIDGVYVQNQLAETVTEVTTRVLLPAPFTR
jgi:hypothetical protein